jgi:DNA (cytosine-5)-methyltransferase 1
MAEKQEPQPNYTSIDLFAGGGGLTEGFRMRGFQCLYANDSDKFAVETFERNHSKAIVTDTPVQEIEPSSLRKQLGLNQGELDVLLGGPPCQGFSTYGNRKTDDPRNRLYEFFVDFLEEFKPKSYLFENVTGLLSIENGNVVADIRDQIEDAGYTSSLYVLDAVEYGVPQFRERVFITGTSENKDISIPSTTHSPPDSEGEDFQLDIFDAEIGENRLTSEKGSLPAVTVQQAVSDLPEGVFVPKQAHETTKYPEHDKLSPYQRLMRKGSEKIFNHSAKQMLGLRRLRLALMKPGDYGTKIIQRIREDGLPEEVINDLLSDDSGLRDLSKVRKQDRKKERELREKLRKGKDAAEDLLESLESGGFANKYRRLEWDQPSHTLVAHMARDCSDFVHPDIDRFISVREAARLQSFPDDYYFEASQFRQFKQIGNAVPPLLAFALAGSIRNALS